MEHAERGTPSVATTTSMKDSVTASVMSAAVTPDTANEITTLALPLGAGVLTVGDDGTWFGEVMLLAVDGRLVAMGLLAEDVVDDGVEAAASTAVSDDSLG
eukprot:3928448-Rhodomonas_salina.2